MAAITRDAAAMMRFIAAAATAAIDAIF